MVFKTILKTERGLTPCLDFGPYNWAAFRYHSKKARKYTAAWSLSTFIEQIIQAIMAKKILLLQNYIYAQKYHGEIGSESNFISEINSQYEKDYSKSEAKQENKTFEKNTKKHFNCEHCDYKCKNKATMTKHNKKHVGQKLNCKQCGKTLNSNIELNTHIINEHTVASMVMQGNHSSLSVQNDTSFVFSESMLDEFDY